MASAPDRSILRHVPRILQERGLASPCATWESEGTAAFVDVSGFTALSEQLAKRGREGAELISDIIGGAFAGILAVAEAAGGNLLKFGGDALLLWFDGEHHAQRAAHASFGMRASLDISGRIELPDVQSVLRMRQAIHSGAFQFFAVGTDHVELLPVGKSWTHLVSLQKAAEIGEIAMGQSTAALLPVASRGAQRKDAVMLVADPGPMAPPAPKPTAVSTEDAARGLSALLRAHVEAGSGVPEHRPVTVAFLHFEDTDELLEQVGPAAMAVRLQRMVDVVDAATRAHDVCFLASDIDENGGKLILAAGAPKVTGNDEERMLLALRAILAAGVPLPIRIGVQRGAVFAGEVGSAHRRTYTVMGDTVNVAARLMSVARLQEIFATAEVLDRSDTVFATTAVPPVRVKGKAEPLQAWSVGEPRGSRERRPAADELPIVGRDDVLEQIAAQWEAAQGGQGQLVVISGDAGIGKSRLVRAVHAMAAGARVLRASCEAYTANAPFASWRGLLRDAFAIARGSSNEQAVATVTALASSAPASTPWLPLLGPVLGLQFADSPSIALLSENARRSKLAETVATLLRLAVPGPLVLTVDNIQHMDESSMELLRGVVGQLEERPWLLVVTGRENRHEALAAALPAALKLRLLPLADEHAKQLALTATEDTPLHPQVLEQVVAKAGGNPQFLLDLALLATSANGEIGLPDSAEAATLARIDALEPAARNALRKASVFGMSFHPRMLAWLGEGTESEATLTTRLTHFLERSPSGWVQFRQPLVRDAAYSGLPFKSRREYHGIIAERLAAEAADPKAVAGTLALHHFAAEQFDAAWVTSLQAAQQARAVFALRDAAAHYQRALAAAPHLPALAPPEVADVQEAIAGAWYSVMEFDKAETATEAAMAIRAQDPVALGRLFLQLSRIRDKQSRYEEAVAVAARGRALLKEVPGEEAGRAAARLLAWTASVLQNQLRCEEARRAGEEAVAEAERFDCPDAMGQALLALGSALGILGREGAIPALRRSIEVSLAIGERAKAAAAMSSIGVLLQAAGQWQEALEWYQKAQVETERAGDLIIAGFQSINIAEILVDRGESDRAIEKLRETLPLLRSTKYRLMHAACIYLWGRAQMWPDTYDEALRRLREARDIFEEAGLTGELPGIESRLAELHFLMGDFAACAAITLRLLALPERDGVPKAAPLLHRLQAGLCVLEGDPAGARAHLREGLALARQRKDLFEVALGLREQAVLAEQSGEAGDPQWLQESADLLQQLEVVRAPRAVLAVGAPATAAAAA